MKIQLSNRKIIKDAITVWHESGPEVDIVMDLKHLTFREGSVTEITAFHVIDHLFAEESFQALQNWYKCLSKEGKVHCIMDDFEYIARGFIGGDISIELFNDIHNHPYQCTRDGVVKLMEKAGFNGSEVVIWINGAPEGVDKKHYEFILTGKK